MTVAYLVKIPTLKGQDLTHKSKETAEREKRNAAKHGHDATIVEVLLNK